MTRPRRKSISWILAGLAPVTLLLPASASADSAKIVCMKQSGRRDMLGWSETYRFQFDLAKRIVVIDGNFQKPEALNVSENALRWAEGSDGSIVWSLDRTTLRLTVSAPQPIFDATFSCRLDEKQL